MIENVGSLSLIASRLLLVILLLGEEAFNSQRKTVQMQMVGTNNPRAYRDARMELEQAGCIHLKREPGKQAQAQLNQQPFLSSAEHGLDNIVGNRLLGSSSNGHTSHVNDIGGYEEYLSESTGWVGKVPNGRVGKVPTTWVGKVPEEENYPGRKGTQVGKVPTLIERCRDVDEMDDSGSITSTKSPFGVRRLAQIPLVQEAYAKYFPQDKNVLNPKNSKAWLSHNNNRAEDVVDGLEDIAQRKPGLESPIGWINVVFGVTPSKQSKQGRTLPSSESSEAQRPAKNQPPLSSAVVVLDRPKVGAGAYVPGGDLPPPSPEYLAQLKEAADHFEYTKQERGWYE